MRIVLAAVLLVALPARGGAAELKGTVLAVSGSEVTIALELPLLPNPGDAVRISFEIPGAGEVPLEGAWVVTEATVQRIVAQASPGNASRPQAGQIALITSADPRPRPAAVPSAPPPPPPAPAAVSPRPEASGEAAPSVPGSNSPAAPAAGAPLAVLPPAAPAFSIRHAHQAFRRLEIADATLTLLPGRVTYQEVGAHVKPEHAFSFSCGEYKQARSGSLNRSEKNSIRHIALREPAKLSVRAAKSYGQMFEEREKVAEIVSALNAHCGKH